MWLPGEGLVVVVVPGVGVIESLLTAHFRNQSYICPS